LKKKEKIDEIERFCREYSVKANYINEGLSKLGATPLERGCKLIDLIARPQLNIESLSNYIPKLKEVMNNIENRKEEIIEAAEVRMKYSGYIRREREIADKMQRLEDIRIRGKFDYDTLQSLSTEARQKLKKIDPETLAQAGRIPGVSPSDINVLLVLLGR
jgi:tRNA uridine 5-carboxymethylaminomethyl modification enzyme